MARRRRPQPGRTSDEADRLRRAARTAADREAQSDRRARPARLRRAQRREVVAVGVLAAVLALSVLLPGVRRPVVPLLEALSRGDRPLGALLGVLVCVPALLGTGLLVRRVRPGSPGSPAVPLLCVGLALAFYLSPVQGRRSSDETVLGGLQDRVPGYLAGLGVGLVLFLTVLAGVVLVTRLRARRELRPAGPSPG